MSHLEKKMLAKLRLDFSHLREHKLNTILKTRETQFLCVVLKL